MAGWASYPTIEKAVNGSAGWGEAGAKPAIAIDPSPSRTKAGEGKRLRIESASAARRQMTKIYREMRSGVLDVNKGTKLIYALDQISRAIERETVEKLTQRLDEVEGK
ncbi:hypothetical protein [Sphingomonas endophytica]|uniref:hypothetical protein n=1 Tax=Sphingomonas endophytica TaxID=869719 RepID=UPI00128FBF80|nr:hypothetical protein [Sphingomonas endophytica]